MDVGGSEGVQRKPLFYSTSLVTDLLFLALIISQTVLLYIGLTGKWIKVPMDVTETTDKYGVSDDDVTRSFSESLYVGGFWFTVKEFWWSGAKAVAGLVVASGEVQPIANIAFLCFIYAYPLANHTREALIKLMEIGGKICLASFFVEALIMTSFHFTFEYTHWVMLREYYAVAKIGLTIYSPLSMYLTAQCLMLFTVNQLQLIQRTINGYPPLTLKDSPNSLLSRRFTTDRSTSRFSRVTQVDDYVEMREVSKVVEESDHRMSTRFRAMVGVSGVLALVCMAVSYFVPFIRLKSHGILAGYITEFGPDQTLDLFDLISAIYTIPSPQSQALYLSSWASILLVVIPIIVPLTAVVAAVVDESHVKAHRVLEAICFFLQPWCATEALVIAAYFLAPNLKTITEFVFDDTDPCPEIDEDIGRECLVTKGILQPIGCTAITLWCVFTIVTSHALMHHHRRQHAPFRQDPPAI